MADEYRVEVELDDEEHGYSLRERLRALDLDDEARDRLGRGAMVTRDGSRVFVYAGSEDQARQAEHVLRTLVEEEQLTAEIVVMRWHPAEEAWKDAAVPLPSSPSEEEAERAAREAAEAAEARAEGDYDWTLVVRLASRSVALDLARRLAAEGYSVMHRWRYVIVGVVTEERAQELAERLRSELPDDVEVRVEVDLSDVARSPLQFLPF